MRLQIATDWDKISEDIKGQIRNVGYNPDLNKLVKNIDSMVVDLSKLEVEARRTRKTTYTQPQVDKINEAIVTVERWIIMAALSK